MTTEILNKEGTAVTEYRRGLQMKALSLLSTSAAYKRRGLSAVTFYYRKAASSAFHCPGWHSSETSCRFKLTKLSAALFVIREKVRVYAGVTAWHWNHTIAGIEDEKVKELTVRMSSWRLLIARDLRFRQQSKRALEFRNRRQLSIVWDHWLSVWQLAGEDYLRFWCAKQHSLKTSFDKWVETYQQNEMDNVTLQFGAQYWGGENAAESIQFWKRVTVWCRWEAFQYLIHSNNANRRSLRFCVSLWRSVKERSLEGRDAFELAREQWSYTELKRGYVYMRSEFILSRERLVSYRYCEAAWKNKMTLKVIAVWRRNRRWHGSLALGWTLYCFTILLRTVVLWRGVIKAEIADVTSSRLGYVAWAQGEASCGFKTWRAYANSYPRQEAYQIGLEVFRIYSQTDLTMIINLPPILKLNPNLALNLTQSEMEDVEQSAYISSDWIQFLLMGPHLSFENLASKYP